MFFILGIRDIVLTKSQDTMIAIACWAFFLNRGYKHAPEQPGIHVSSVESRDRTEKCVDQNVRNVRDPVKTWRAGRECTGIRSRLWAKL